MPFDFLKTAKRPESVKRIAIRFALAFFVDTPQKRDASR